MAAISSARGDPTALTPPSSSHGDETTPWGHSRKQSQTMQDKNGSAHFDQTHRQPLYPHNGNSSTAPHKSGFETGARKMQSLDNLYSSRWDKAVDSSGLSSSFSTESKMGRSDWSSYNNHSSSDDLKRPAPQKSDSSLGHDKWIHRDKLAKIENEELQAAGFYVPRSRAQSKQRRDRSTKREADAQDNAQARPKNESDMQHWDLRTPEEIAEEESSTYFVPNGAKGGSRIPVAKVSPAPISQDYLERGVPTPRKATESPEGESTTITYPKSRSRSASATVRDPTPGTPGRTGRGNAPMDGSPKKSTANRKTSGSSKSSTTTGRPKTRSGPNKDSQGGTSTRPHTRSGDSVSSIKAPEGDPPWMFNSYKPDPRLPPEQQIIPTVARRLAQEKWEKEGKFGDVYDKDFRPLNDNPLFKVPAVEHHARSDELHMEQNQDHQDHQDHRDQTTQDQSDEWPLKTELSKSPTTRQGSSYSTMPKISDKPPMSPIPSPRTPISPQTVNQQQPQPLPLPLQKEGVQQVPVLSDEEEKKGGCGCCVVM
ncbi:hypothetical protein PT974_04371 [Cladobotryum mycophilum]|uniref:TeaA receptor TeaR n=1 Tax=Cladobotryum mycophilum TaxID=491253 RepID=A0ABR0SUW9_9HYPO